MAILSRRGRLAIAAVVDIAVHAVDAPVSAKALAARHNLPPRHLEPLLQALVRAGILKGLRGPRGGYDVARERQRINCAEIVHTAVGTLSDEFESLSPLVEAVIVPAMAEAERDYFDRLAKISVADLCARAASVRFGAVAEFETA
ncbi:MAG: BadM/Rrf2 family transcriptional regulator [Xanthobacteraceae bacterium]|nr:MAG: BadM/Rrf2 family transcriptional regulator [Xanthobacteraceae bacterium]